MLPTIDLSAESGYNFGGGVLHVMLLYNSLILLY